MTVPIEIRNRPFSIEPNTLVMMPDGIFDAALVYQEIAFFVTNISKRPITRCMVRPDMRRKTEWTYSGNPMDEIGYLSPGESRLVRWLARFDECTPGKKALPIEFGAEVEDGEFSQGYDGYIGSRIFVSRTTQLLGTNRFRCEVPEGALDLDILEYSTVPGWKLPLKDENGNYVIDIPPLPIIEKVSGKTLLVPGMEDAIPFQDPWWKVVAWIVAVLAYLGAIIAAKEGQGTASIGVSGEWGSGNGGNWCTPDPMEAQDKMTVAGVLSVIGSSAIRVGMMDVRDPWQKGRDFHPNDPGDPRVSEIVEAVIDPPDELRAGDVWHVPINWNYTATTRSGVSRSVAKQETGHSENAPADRRVEYPEEVSVGEAIVVGLYLEHSDGTPYLGDELYGFVTFISPIGRVYRRDFQNVGFLDRKPLPPGYFEAGLHTEKIGPEHGWEEMCGKWSIQLHGQIVNRAPEGIDPFVAATFVGGDAVFSTVRLSKVASVASGKSATKCQPDNAFNTYVR